MNMNHKGFTLIELILSMLLLSMLATYTWVSMDSTFKTQKSIERFSDLYESTTVVIEKISLDINQMFLIPSTQNLTYLQGKEREIAFTSLSHAVFQATQRSSEQTEISYKTESNPDRRGLDLLLRTETGFIDGPIENLEDVEPEPLTGQISELLFEYSKDGVDYVKQWDTTGRVNKDQLPKIIRLTLGMKESSDPDDDREVLFRTFIDIPMSDAFTQAAPAANGNNPNGQGNNPNAQGNNRNAPGNNQNRNQPGRSQLNPFGVN